MQSRQETHLLGKPRHEARPRTNHGVQVMEGEDQKDGEMLSSARSTA